jgi:hypothetical protein
MQDLDRLQLIARRARMVYRLRNGVQGGIRVAIAAASATFVVMLLSGLGFVPTYLWENVALAGGGAVLLAGIVSACRRIDDQVVIQRVDQDYGFGNALATTYEFVRDAASLTPMALAHVNQSLTRAEGLRFGRVVTTDLGAPARILGILCMCIVSLAVL